MANRVRSILKTLLPALFVLQAYCQQQFCAPDGVCVGVNIPSAEVNSGSPDLYITLQAPASAKWFATGFGNQMAGSLMLVAWPYYNEVVVSTRLATAESLPPVYHGAEVSILSRTVASNVTSVQIKCSNCTTWPGGNLNVKSTSADFIYAYGTTAPASPANSGSSFLQHVGNGGFTLDLVKAQSSSTTAPTITGGASSGGGLTQRQWIIIMHGVTMAIIWAVLFPFGAVIIRFLGDRMRNAVGKHRIVQISSLVMLLGAGGAGIYLAWGHQFTLFHHFFGIAIMGAAVIQAFFGGYHHYRFIRDHPTSRRWFTHVHLWLGRSLILCGLANCGFGLLAAGKPTSYAIIWWVASGVLAALYAFFYVIKVVRARGRGKGVRYTVPGAGPEYAAGEGYEMNPYVAPTMPLVGQAAGPGYYTPPRRFEPDRKMEGSESVYLDQEPEPYDPPRRQFMDAEPVQRYASPSGQRE